MPIKLSTTAQKESNAVKLKVATNQILRKDKNIVTIIAIIIVRIYGIVGELLKWNLQNFRIFLGTDILEVRQLFLTIPPICFHFT